MSSLDRPEVSGPKTIETFWFKLVLKMPSVLSWIESMGTLILLSLAVVPITRLESATASSRVSNTLAFSKISSHTEYRAHDSGCGCLVGLTRERFLKPMVPMALAAAPTLPGWEGSTKINSTLSWLINMKLTQILKSSDILHSFQIIFLFKHGPKRPNSFSKLGSESG